MERKRAFCLILTLSPRSFKTKRDKTSRQGDGIQTKKNGAGIGQPFDGKQQPTSDRFKEASKP